MGYYQQTPAKSKRFPSDVLTGVLSSNAPYGQLDEGTNLPIRKYWADPLLLFRVTSAESVRARLYLSRWFASSPRI
jgi:hypothetical protein